MPTPTFTSGPDTYTVTAPGDYILDFLGGDDSLTVAGGTTTTATMDDGNDYVRLQSGMATVDGGAGDDRFDILASGVTASGGIGNDLFVMRGGSDQTIHGDDGNDRVNLAANVSNINADLGAGDDSFVGYGYTLTGNIYGGSGADTFVDISGSSNLNIYGGTGDDVYRAWGANYANFIENPGEGADTVEVSRGMNYTLPDNIERIVLGSYQGSTGLAATLTGNALANGITGSGNSETIFGLDGNDRLLGKGGDDIIHGGNDNDLVDGGLGNDTLYGDAGSDSLVGREGNDTMIGGTGNDTYYVDSLGDSVIENPGEGTDAIRTTVTLTLADNIEYGVVASTTGIGLYGNALDNHLYGNAGTDTLDGGDGNDYIRGGASDDFLYGGNGNDVLGGDAGNDTQFGQDGNDLVNGGDGNDNLYGGAGHDVLNGGNGDDFLVGGDGADTITGNAGSDRFVFLATTDSLPGSADSITDMQSNAGPVAGDDILDFSAIDANTTASGDQAFAWSDNTAAANSIWYSSIVHNSDGSADMVLNADVNGDTTADFQLMVHLTTGTLAVDDLIL
jgi:Ca2+-binding RTX toxin-like protein